MGLLYVGILVLLYLRALVCFIGAQPQKSKTAKNAKKNMGKGKKKSSNQKTDVAQTLEANGPHDNNKVNAE